MNKKTGVTVAPSREEIENFFVENERLDALRNRLSRFNIIETMGRGRLDLMHSVCLAWLIDPQETHGLQDEFTRSFLVKALKGSNIEGGPSAVDILQSDMSDIEVRSERDDTEIYVSSQRNEWVFVIESEFDNEQCSSQLENHVIEAENDFPGMRVIGVSLTHPRRKPQSNRYVHIQFSSLHSLVQGLTNSLTRPLSTDVGTFIKHYLEVIKEVTTMNNQSNDLARQARELYQSHKKVIDFITQQNSVSSNITVEPDVSMEAIFGDACDLVFGNERKRGALLENISGMNVYFETIRKANDKYLERYYARFLPESWSNAMHKNSKSWPECDGTKIFKQPLHVDLSIYMPRGKPSYIRIHGQLMKSSTDDRQKIADAIINAANRGSWGRLINFNSTPFNANGKQSAFFPDNRNSVDNAQDAKSIAMTMKETLTKYQHAIDAIGKSLGELKF